MRRAKSKKTKRAHKTTSTSKSQVATGRKAARTESSAVNIGDVAEKAIPVTEQSHGGQMTNEHHLPKEDSCTISTSSPDSAYSELTGTPPLVQNLITRTKNPRKFEVCCIGVTIVIVCLLYTGKKYNIL